MATIGAPRTVTPTAEGYLALGRKFYQNASHPMWPSRDQEFTALSAFAYAYGYEIDEVDFDNIIAEFFSDGCDYEWPA